MFGYQLNTFGWGSTFDPVKDGDGGDSHWVVYPGGIDFASMSTETAGAGSTSQATPLEKAGVHEPADFVTGIDERSLEQLADLIADRLSARFETDGRLPFYSDKAAHEQIAVIEPHLLDGMFDPGDYVRVDDALRGEASTGDFGAPEQVDWTASFDAVEPAGVTLSGGDKVSSGVESAAVLEIAPPAADTAVGRFIGDFIYEPVPDPDLVAPLAPAYTAPFGREVDLGALDDGPISSLSALYPTEDPEDWEASFVDQEFDAIASLHSIDSWIAG